jgi:hypothetical protein
VEATSRKRRTITAHQRDQNTTAKPQRIIINISKNIKSNRSMNSKSLRNTGSMLRGRSRTQIRIRTRQGFRGINKNMRSIVKIKGMLTNKIQNINEWFNTF